MWYLFYSYFFSVTFSFSVVSFLQLPFFSKYLGKWLWLGFSIRKYGARIGLWEVEGKLRGFYVGCGRRMELGVSRFLCRLW